MQIDSLDGNKPHHLFASSLLSLHRIVNKKRYYDNRFSHHMSQDIMYKNGSSQVLYCEHITTLQLTINRHLNSRSIKTRI